MARFKLYALLAWAVALTSVIQPGVAAASLPNLRIMPLGDSITKGSGSSDTTGYRKRLRNKLTGAGAEVDMIGSLADGSMPDNSHEGHSGKYLADIREYYKLSVAAQPNVVLVHAGTNNMDKEVDLDIAEALIESIIDGLFKESPNTIVLVTPVIWANDARMQANTDKFNAKLKSLISTKQKAGKNVAVVSVDISLDDLSDKKHPNDVGYEKMATAWFNGIMDANDKGWIKDPKKVDAGSLPGMGLGVGGGDGGGGDGDGQPGCKGGNWRKEGKIFDGIRVWEEKGVIIGAAEDASRDKVILADLNGDGKADYILADKDGSVRAWINSGDFPNGWKPLGKINPSWDSLEITGDMVRMADVDNDGKADMFVLYKDGSVRVWKNVDNGKEFEKLDADWATAVSREAVTITDVDGDGYADYVVIYGENKVRWSRNTHNNGKDPSKRNFETLTEIASGVAGVPPDRARLVDLDGDGKADYVIVYDGGAVKALTNTGNLNKDGNRRNWDDIGTIAPGVTGVTGDMIEFADMDGDGLADFLAVQADGSIKMWKGLGLIGGNKGDSMRFADLTGNGKDDIISVNSKGAARAWINKGVGKWDDIGEIAPGPNEDLSNAQVVFADVNGDKKADYLVIYEDGSVKAFLNNGNLPSKSGRIWQDGIEIAPGVGEAGRKVRFADLNGDGYADYLILYDGGAVDAFLNKKNIPPKDGGRIWEQRSTVATGVGEPGDKIVFADITGDGKDEYIVQYEGGAAIAYNNTGNIPDVGRPRNWYKMGVIAAGVNPQGPVRYADINGDGKADYLVVFEDGTINAYINTCDWKFENPNDGGGGGGGGGGSDGLGPDSSCKDVQDVAKEDPGDGSIPAKIWDALKTQPYFESWLAYDRDVTKGVISAFAIDWGHDSVSCAIWNECTVPNSCAGYSKDKGSGQAHVILRSLFNLHSYFKAMQEAIDRTESRWAVLAEAFRNEYFPDPEEPDSLAMNIILGIAGPLWDIGATYAGSDTGDIAAGLFGAIADGITTAMDEDPGDPEHGAELGLAAFEYLNSSVAIIRTLHDDLLQKGYRDTGERKVVLDDLVKGGKWLDASSIPILNTNPQKKRTTIQALSDWYFNFFHAHMLNFSWRNTIVFIVGAEMSEEQYGKTEDHDGRRTYYDGKAYFLMSYSYIKKGPQNVYQVQEPPGYDALDDPGLGANFDIEDVIRSSVDSYIGHGFNFTGTSEIDSVIETGNWDEWSDLRPRLAGTFNIPVCMQEIPDDNGVSFDYFIRRLLHPADSPTAGSFLCLCRDQKDKNGKDFESQLVNMANVDCAIKDIPGR